MTQFNFQPRLQIYHNLLGKYDILDKYQFSKINFTCIDSIRIIYTSKKFLSNSLNFILAKEFLTQQCFDMSKKRKNLSQNFIITLRKTFIFMYLELLINTSFIDSEYYFRKHCSFKYINLILKFSYFHNFKLHLNDINKGIKKELIPKINFIFKESNYYIKTFLSYYYII